MKLVFFMIEIFTVMMQQIIAKVSVYYVARVYIS